MSTYEVKVQKHTKGGQGLATPLKRRRLGWEQET